LGGLDTLHSKNMFEHKALHCGVQVQQYHLDNGVFTKLQFCDALFQTGQLQQVSGVGAYHQNGSDEHAICTIQDMTHTMMLHVSVQWLDAYNL